MTATQPTNPVCPECGGTNTMVLSDGMARCFDDQHEWNPDEVSALPRPVRVPEAHTSGTESPPADSGAEQETAGGALPAEVADTTLSPPPPVVSEPLSHDEMIGGTARLEGGQVAQVLSFPDDDHVMVRLNDGRDELVALSDVERITPRAPEYVIDVDEPAVDVVPGWALDVEALSNLIMRAGLAAIEEQNGQLVVGDPPADWLPRDESTNALVEAAAALAVARLVVAYDVDRADVLEYLDRQMDNVGDHEQEETSE